MENVTFSRDKVPTNLSTTAMVFDEKLSIMDKNNTLQNKKILIVAPRFLEWDLGGYIKSILFEKNLDCGTFAHQPVKTDIDAGRHLIKIAKQYKPDIILGLKLDKIKASVIKELKKECISCVLWYMDCVSGEVPDWIKPLFKEVDVFFSTAKGMLPEYKSIADTPAYWVYEGAHLPMFSLLPKNYYLQKIYRSEVAFVGSLYYWDDDRNISLRREDFLKKIHKKYQLNIWGPQGVRDAKERWGRNYQNIEWPAFNEELVKVCRGAKIILGINTVNSVELYFSNRT